MLLILAYVPIQAAITFSSSGGFFPRPLQLCVANVSGEKKIGSKRHISLPGLVLDDTASSFCLMVQRMPYPGTNSTMFC